MRTSGPEAAPLDPLRGVGHHPLYGGQWLPVLCDDRYGIQQPNGIGMLGIPEQFPGRRLLHDMARIHDNDRITQLAHHSQIMGNEQNRGVKLLVHLANQIQNLGLDGHIQSRCGLIRNQYLGLAGQCHGNHHTLPHSSRHLMGILMGPYLRIGDSHCLHHADGFLHGFLFLHAPVQPQGFGNLFTALDNGI